MKKPHAYHQWYPYSNRVISVESYSNRSYRDTYFHLKHHHCRVKSNSIWVWWVWFSQTSETQLLMCLQNEHSSWPENSLEGGVSLKECSGRLHILNESVAWTLIHLASIFLSSKPQRRAKCPLAGKFGVDWAQTSSMAVAILLTGTHLLTLLPSEDTGQILTGLYSPLAQLSSQLAETI